MKVRGAALVATLCGACLIAAALLPIPRAIRANPLSGARIACPPITGIAHVSLHTDHLAAAERFYGHVLGFDKVGRGNGPDVQGRTVVFKVNDHQYIEISPGRGDPRTDLLVEVAFETTNARELRRYLEGKAASEIGVVHKTPEGNLGFTARDPEGHPVEFIQYLPNSIEGRQAGTDMPDTRISRHIIHAGFIVHNRAAEDSFFRDALGFNLMWYGGMTDSTTDWVDMRVPNGSNWLEYMLNARNPSLHTLGVLYHFSLGVPSVANSYKTVVERGYQPKKPQIGRDGKWQLNLYDPDGTRVEMMEPKPVRKPCCSPIRE